MMDALGSLLITLGASLIFAVCYVRWVIGPEPFDGDTDRLSRHV